MLRKQYNRNQYRKRLGRDYISVQISSTPPSLATLPTSLRAQAEIPLPDTCYLFKEALKGPAYIDESDLLRWDGGPPYDNDPSFNGNTPEDQAHTVRLRQVLHGRNLRLQREDDQKRAEEVCGVKDARRVRKHLQATIVNMLDEWLALEHFLPDYKGTTREIEIAHLFTQWHARTIVHYVEIVSRLTLTI